MIASCDSRMACSTLTDREPIGTTLGVRTYVLSMLVLALVACDKNAVTELPEPPYLDAQLYCESIADFFCDFYMRCDRMDVPNLATCKEVFFESCNSRYEPLYVALASEGLVKLSRAGIETCEAHLGSVACDAQITDLNGPCAAMWEGQVAEGGACGFDLESFSCAPGTTCTLDLSFCGTCERVLAPGESCAEGTVGTCGPDGACVNDVCVTRVSIGAACTPDDRCQVGSMGCVEGVCAGPVYVGIGDTCDYGHRCPYLSNCEDEVCVAAQRHGESCEGSACENGFCNAAEICEALLPPGAPCEIDAQCAQLRCDEASGACAAVPGACFD